MKVIELTLPLTSLMMEQQPSKNISSHQQEKITPPTKTEKRNFNNSDITKITNTILIVVRGVAYCHSREFTSAPQ
jgi:hypothetical protein